MGDQKGALRTVSGLEGASRGFRRDDRYKRQSIVYARRQFAVSTADSVVCSGSNLGIVPAAQAPETGFMLLEMSRVLCDGFICAVADNACLV
jgi:hypothetical protein